jgi:H+/gluconate symporter-like permease
MMMIIIIIVIIVIIIITTGMRLSPLVTAVTISLLYRPKMIDDVDCGAIGEMRICRGKRSTRRKPAPVPLCQPQPT